MSILPVRRRAALLVAASVVAAGLVTVAASSQPSAPPEPVRFENAPLASWRLNGEARATLIVGDRVYVGGSFTTVTSPDGSVSVPRTNLAAFDVRTGALLTQFAGTANGIVRAFATDGQRLYVGGSFTSINGASRSRLAALDLATGAVASGWAPSANSNVFALELVGDRLYVGGSFSTLAGQARSRLAAVSPATGALLPFAPTFDNTVGTLAVAPSGDRVYAGGSFLNVNGAANRWMATLDANGQVVPTPWNLVGIPVDLAIDPTGERIAIAEAGSANFGSWRRTDTGAVQWVQRCDGDAQAVHVMGGTVLTGFHEACQGDYSQRLVANDAADGSRDYDFRPSFDRFWGVRAFDGVGDRLVVAGDFTLVEGVAASGIAIFATRAAPVEPVRLPGGAVWRYHASTSAAPLGWEQPGFDDSSWPSGRAQLGYGDGDEATVLPTGAQATPRPITSYFRTAFVAAAVPETLTLRLVADDSAVVYLNGTEVVRENLPAGPVLSSTRAIVSRNGDEENAFTTYALPPELVQVGANTLAVEVHQDSSTSSDVSFLAALSSTGAIPEPTTTTTTTEPEPTTTTTTVPEPTTTTTTVPEPEPTTTTTTLPEPTTTTTVPEPEPTTTTTTLPEPTTTTTTLPEPTTTTTTLPEPTTTTTLPEPTTTTTTVPEPTTTTTIPTDPPDDPVEPPPAVPIRVDRFDGDDGAPWSAGWTTSTAAGAATLQGGEGRLSYDDVSGAFARAQLTGVAPQANGELRFSYRWASTGHHASFSAYLRGANGWRNGYRPRDGYGIEIQSNTRHVVIRRAINGSASTILGVPTGQTITTARQHVRLRVVGNTISFKIWLDGTPEPATWHTVVDEQVTGPGQVHLSLVRNSTNAGPRAVAIDDLVLTDGS